MKERQGYLHHHYYMLLILEQTRSILNFNIEQIQFEPLRRKPVFGVSDQVRHKPSCTTTEYDWKLEISYLGSRGIGLSVQRKTKTLISYREADLRLCLRICKKPGFS